MSQNGKSPILILIVLILISLFLAGGLFFLLQKEKIKSSGLQTELENLKETQKATEAKLSDSQKMLSELEAKLQDAQGQIDTLTRDLEQEKADKQETAGQIEQLKAELEQQKKLQVDSENKLLQAQEETRKLLEQLKTLDSRKLELETKLKNLEVRLQQAQSKNVELGTIVVSPESTASVPATASQAASAQAKKKTAPSSREGKILVVNKDYSFAVMNLGSKDGVNVGDIFEVYHNNKYIGEVKIDKVHDAMSAAGFASGDLKDKISEGDKTVQKTK